MYAWCVFVGRRGVRERESVCVCERERMCVCVCVRVVGLRLDEYMYVCQLRRSLLSALFAMLL